jgi:hypothetical protein
MMPDPMMPDPPPPIIPPPMPVPTMPDHYHEVSMLRSGRFPIEAQTFAVDGHTYLLCTRRQPSKGVPSYYLISLPSRDYVSALFPRAGGRYSLDFRGRDGAERVFEVDFSESGFIRLTDKGLSHRSLRPAPWQRGSRSPRRD